MILLNFSDNSQENEVLFVNIRSRFWDLWLGTLLWAQLAQM